MKNQFFILIAFSLIGCSALKTDYSNSYWAEMTSDTVSLFKNDHLNSDIGKELTKGSIIFFASQQGDFYKVYLKDPRGIKSKSTLNTLKYYAYKPKFKKMDTYSETEAKIYELPFDSNKFYISGERGGCYYINKYGSRTYVDRNYCSKAKSTSTKYKNNTYKSTKSSSTSVQCSGRTKSGARCKNKTTNPSGRCHLH